MDPRDLSRYRSWLLSNPSAFVEGVRGFCKQAAGGTITLTEDDPLYSFVKARKGMNAVSETDQDFQKYMALKRRAAASKPAASEEKGLWDRLKPWVIGLGGGYLALRAGDKWGRFAQKHGYTQGPIKGPLTAAFGSLLGPDYKLQGTSTREEAAQRDQALAETRDSWDARVNPDDVSTPRMRAIARNTA